MYAFDRYGKELWRMNFFWGYLIGYAYLFGIILGVGAAYKIFKFPSELSRKLIHILICFTWLVLYRFFEGSWQILVMPVSFVIINALSLKFKFFKGMEREGEKSTPGTVYYAAAITVLTGLSLIIPETLVPGGIAIFCLSFGDGFAAIAGEFFGKYSPKITKTKSLVGTLACLVFSVAGVYILAVCLPEPLGLSFPQVLIIGAATSVLELAGWGLDNFTISFGIVALATLFREKWIF